MVNMDFVAQCNRIFAQAVADYHRTDDVDAAICNPYATGTIEYDLYLEGKYEEFLEIVRNNEGNDW